MLKRMKQKCDKMIMKHPYEKQTLPFVPHLNFFSGPSASQGINGSNVRFLACFIIFNMTQTVLVGKTAI